MPCSFRYINVTVSGHENADYARNSKFPDIFNVSIEGYCLVLTNRVQFRP